MTELEKIDAIRARMNISYEQAQRALAQSGGDVIQALVLLEKKPGACCTDKDSWTEKVQVQGSELVEKVKEVIREGNVRKVVVKHEDRVVFEIPLTIGAIGAIIAPQLAAIGAVAALLTRCTIEIERTGASQKNPDEPKL
ncbi:MAG: DUF4342 domain-containing protein [Bacillota bacterium]|jgi:hypothetical protein|nr:DUF4342 domain-containing protein [Bacillota bacterium]